MNESKHLAHARRLGNAADSAAARETIIRAEQAKADAALARAAEKRARKGWLRALHAGVAVALPRRHRSGYTP